MVLEAGNDHRQDPRVNIPALWSGLRGSDVDWNFATTPQHNLGNRILKEPQGKLLGGSSAMNAQSWIAASKATIDSWSKVGNPTWTWDTLLPYYRKSYTLNDPDETTKRLLSLEWVDKSVHGDSGPVQVSFPALLQDPLPQAWLEAFKSLGYSTDADPHSGKSAGAYCNLAAVDPRTKTRSYAASAYAAPAMERSNLHLLTEAAAQKVVFDGVSPGLTATEVEVDVKGQAHHVKALKEVIISAGALNTPKLLELSGIGKKELLAQHSIPVMVDNPNVGENLQDHLMSGISFEVAEGIMTGDPLVRREPEAIQAAMKMYTENQSGPMTVGRTVASAFMPLLEFAGPDGQAKQQELFDQLLPPTITSGYQKTLRNILEDPNETTCSMFMFPLKANLHESSEEPDISGNYISLGAMQSTTFSRGSVHISSADPKDDPIIDPRYFSHPLDLEIMARNLLDVERLHTVDPLAQHLKPKGRRNHPDAFLTDLDSAKKYVRDTATTAFHSCGTASMLPQDKGGVVDEHLKVYGTRNLRVVDASIFPVSPRANLMATVYAVAERAADIIKSGS